LQGRERRPAAAQDRKRIRGPFSIVETPCSTVEQGVAVVAQGVSTLAPGVSTVEPDISTVARPFVMAANRVSIIAHRGETIAPPRSVPDPQFSMVEKDWTARRQKGNNRIPPRQRPGATRRCPAFLIEVCNPLAENNCNLAAATDKWS